ncbi:MAG: putative sensor protein [Frankiales bacterium]|nr:putative sensor protein [Frankiales bacterium]
MQAGPVGAPVGRLDGVEVQLQLAKEVAGLGMWEWDAQTGTVTWDARAESLFGLPPGGFAGTLEAYDALIHPDDRQASRDALERVVREGGNFRSQPRAVWPDGSVHHLLARGQALTAADGRVVAVLGVVFDVTELRQAVDAESEAARRLAGLADVALELAHADSVDDLQRTVIGRGVSVLGADGGAVCVRDDAAGVVRLAVSEQLPEHVQVEYGELPLSGPLPGSRTSRTGEAFFLPDVAAGLAVTPEMQQVYDGTGRQAWAALPLRARGRLLGSLVVSWTEPRPFPRQERELLGAFAAQCAQALDRILTLEAERTAALAASRLSETLQRSLLTDPPQPDHLHVAVRYQPAGQLAQVGGDWYDAFLTADGATCLVIGDVTGHDRDAAAQMGALRNLLRATAYALDLPPAGVLRGLERAMDGLGVGALATGVLARVEQPPEAAAQSVRVLRWANAGHLPPMLLDADGGVTVLATEPDLLLGLVPDTDRTDHTVELAPGSTLLLFTDGLVERRGEDLDVGIARLQACLTTLAATAGDDLEALLDGVLAALLDGEVEDDVALVAVRMNDPREPRPVEAGPSHTPQDDEPAL